MKIDSGVVLVDGGMGKHLERCGAPFRQPEWSALALMEDPDAVRDAHRAFIAAGARAITVNSYAVVPFHIGDDRFRDRGLELASLAGRLAREAADEAPHDVLVVGSLPPLFGSYEPASFEPDLAPSMYEVLVGGQAPFVDVWLGETVSSIAEGLAVVSAVESGPGPDELWLSMTVPDDEVGERVTLRSGESIEAAVDALAAHCSALLFNCSSPEAIGVGLAELGPLLRARHPEVRFGGYANAFKPRPATYSANSELLGAREELTPERYREIVEGWVASGSSIVGGCCQIHTEHIEALALALPTA